MYYTDDLCRGAWGGGGGAPQLELEASSPWTRRTLMRQHARPWLLTRSERPRQLQLLVLPQTALLLVERSTCLQKLRVLAHYNYANFTAAAWQ